MFLPPKNTEKVAKSSFPEHFRVLFQFLMTLWFQPTPSLSFTSALPSLQNRCKSAPNPFLSIGQNGRKMGLTRESHGRKKGVTFYFCLLEYIFYHPYSYAHHYKIHARNIDSSLLYYHIPIPYMAFSALSILRI